MGGPDMAPQTPQRSGHPGEAVAPLDYASASASAPSTPARSPSAGGTR